MSAPRRAVIYARYSTDMQNEKSIEDQIDHCRDYAAREGLIVVDVFEDRAVSGASMHNRPGIKSLLVQAQERRFDCVLAETMSRIARDQEDRAAIRKRLRFHDIDLMTPSTGIVQPMTDGFLAVVVICPLLSGPISILGMATKEEWNGKEAQAGRYHWQVA